MPIRACAPTEVPVLLPQALDGEFALAPGLSQATVDRWVGAADAVPTDTMLVLPTSGSTGRPKAAVLTRRALLASAQGTRMRLGGFTWHCPLDTGHIAGIQVWLRGLLDARLGLGQGTRAVSSSLTDIQLVDGRNAISIVPTQLYRALGDRHALNRLAAMDLVLLGAAPVAPGQLAAARAAGVRIVTTYGMTETCGGCVYDGEPLPGVQLELLDVDAEGVGRIGLRGAVLFSGYLGETGVTAESFSDGLLRTHDLGRLDTDGRLRVVGRVDDVVISGGLNVNLATVQQAVDDLVAAEGLQLPGGVAVVDLPDPEWGAYVVLVVTDRDAPPIDWWRERLAERLERTALPRRLLAVNVLPRTGSGKIDRRALRTALAKGAN